MHNVELMMSLIVASTALAGLQVVVVNQMVQRLIRTGKIWLRICAVIALILSLLTVWGAANWLISENHMYLSTAEWSFSIQMLTFAFMVGGLTALATE